ncbi:hypothetical protein P152DRAFT_453608 [Eremomyces bilateralis CBS 781.70]|uniref:Protein kinase domain-containing protein n=1 Tax=Eremomyces bilateralis CBS 781.70 TaxID=1392243 RepID=A0A6G1GGG8_9PEZI|nr:uncharacterized protein P152DRAFT_453608 [Eremomyces bilateralis CBS 781.70]KAF1817001.1 hypothetical protein P152DRAFT_453608 [Eremomyces bilateralis CBS 781.70]
MAELGLAIFASIDICYKYGKELVAICGAFNGAEVELRERTLRINLGWRRIAIQLDFLKRVQHLMEDDHRVLHEKSLQTFGSKLKLATSMMNRLVETRATASHDVELVPKRVKYSLKKEGLDKAIEDLEAWQRASDPSWFLILRMADRQLDTEISTGAVRIADSVPSTLTIRGSVQSDGSTSAGKGITLSATELQALSTEPIAYCDAELALRANDGQKFILDRVHRICPSDKTYRDAKQTVRDLARKLTHNEPLTFGLLSCKGFVTEVSGTGPDRRATFTMVLRTLKGYSNPRSLRHYVVSDDCLESLSQRVEIAQDLAKSVSYVHTFGFVHKNIRPETVLACRKPGTTELCTFLIGFDDFRREDNWTLRRGYDDWEKNLYCHPSRQGATPAEDYDMRHDIYSLGVCMLEIGLWQSFVEYNAAGNASIPSSILEKARVQRPEQLASYLLTSMKDKFVSLAHDRLPRAMGSKYAEIVVTCLTCLDPENPDFGDQSEFEDEDGIHVGVRYIEKVLLRLNNLCI